MFQALTKQVISHSERLKGFRTVYPDAGLVDPSSETDGELYIMETVF